MEKISIKNYIKDLPQCLLATMLIAFGVSLYVECQIGSDALTVFLVGMNKTFDIPVSLCDQCVAFILLLCAYLMNKSHIGISTLLNACFIGSCIAVAQFVIEPLHISTFPFIIKMIIVVVGQISLSTGSAILQVFSSGKSIYDAFLFGLMERIDLSYIQVSLIYGITFMCVGFLLGGIIGVGTLISVLSAGLFTTNIKKVLIRCRHIFLSP